MNASATSLETAPGTEATQRMLRTWINECNEFRRRERRDIFEQVPSEKRLASYRQELKWMIRAAHALLNIVSDPDFPTSHFRGDISGKVLQLEDSWRSLNNPMSDSEAEAVLDKAFRDETRTGRVA